MVAVLELTGISVVRDRNRILDSLDWTVEADQRWVVLGPNGAGKTTLLQVASATIHPTSGKAKLLGDPMGKIDVFELRPRIGFASTALARRIPANETVLDVVMTAAYSVTGRWNEKYEDVDVRRAHRVLGEWKLDHLEGRMFGTLSDGEQKRVQIARSVMTDPELLLLDEPAASLDLGAREELLQLLGSFASSDREPRDGHGHAPRRGDPGRASPTRCCSPRARCRRPARSPRSSPATTSATRSGSSSSCRRARTAGTRPAPPTSAGRAGRDLVKSLLGPSAHNFPLNSRSIAMKTDIHPEYKAVVFRDLASGETFLTRSTVTSDKTIELDGETYPVIDVEISSASHPFYTGKQRILDSAGRVEKFNSRYKSFGK